MPSLIEPEEARRIAAEIDEIARRLNLGEAMEAVRGFSVAESFLRDRVQQYLDDCYAKTSISRGNIEDELLDIVDEIIARFDCDFDKWLAWQKEANS